MSCYLVVMQCRHFFQAKNGTSLKDLKAIKAELKAKKAELKAKKAELKAKKADAKQISSNSPC